MSEEFKNLSRDELIARLKDKEASSKTTHPSTGSIVKSAFLLWLIVSLLAVIAAFGIFMLAVSWA